jgi:hypothetical protein
MEADMGDEREPRRLVGLLESVDRQLAGAALDDRSFAELDRSDLHHAHGVAGRLQDRVITILSRLTMELADREED